MTSSRHFDATIYHVFADELITPSTISVSIDTLRRHGVRHFKASIMKKVCSKCKKDKCLSDYYKETRSRLGVQPSCKDCCKKRDKERYPKERDRQLETSRKRYRENRKAILKSHKEYRKSGSYKKSLKKWIDKNPEKQKAHRIYSNEVKKGNIIKGSCEVCGKKKVDAHHDDYSKPLDVRYLCRLHHMEHHSKLNNLKWSNNEL